MPDIFAGNLLADMTKVHDCGGDLPQVMDLISVPGKMPVLEKLAEITVFRQQAVFRPSGPTAVEHTDFG